MALALYRKKFAHDHPDLKQNEIARIVSDTWRSTPSIQEEFQRLQHAVDESLERSPIELIQRSVLAETQARRLQSGIPASGTGTTKDVQTHWKVRNGRFVRVLTHWGVSLEEQRLGFESALTAFTRADEQEDEDEEMGPMVVEQPQANGLGSRRGRRILEEALPPGIVSLDMFLLYRAVCHLGGFSHVTTHELWSRLASPGASPPWWWSGDDGSGVCAHILSDRKAGEMLRNLYYDRLYRFEQSYQNPLVFRTPRNPASQGVPCPRDPAVSARSMLKNVRVVPCVYSGNYFEQPGISILFTSLISGVESEVVWALNELLVMTQIQPLSVAPGPASNTPTPRGRAPLKLEDFPQLLDALLHLLREYAFSSLAIRTTAAPTPLDVFRMVRDMEERRITWPDLSGALMTILANLSQVPHNHKLMATQQVCVRLVFLVALSAYEDLAVLAGTVISSVAYYLELTPTPQWLSSLVLWMERCFGSGDRVRVQQALHCLMLLAARNHGHQLFVSIISHGMYLSLLSYLQDAVHEYRKELLMAVQAVFCIVRGGDKVRIRLCNQTDLLPRLVRLLSFKTEPSEGEYTGSSEEEFDRKVQRTAAATVWSLFEHRENHHMFEEIESAIFEACRNGDVAFFLAPLLVAFTCFEK